MTMMNGNVNKNCKSEVEKTSLHKNNISTDYIDNIIIEKIRKIYKQENKNRQFRKSHYKR